jgi:hypothetical protein
MATGPYASYSTSSSAVADWTLVYRQCVSDVMLSLTELHESSNLYIAYISVIIYIITITPVFLSLPETSICRYAAVFRLVLVA